MARLPPPHLGRSSAFPPQAAVHQPGHRADSAGVLPMVSVSLSYGLEAAQPANRVLHHDPSPRERAVVRDVLRRPRFATRLAAWRCPQPLRVQRSDADIRQVTQPADPLWQPLQ